MEWLRAAGLAALSLTVAPARDPRPYEEPLPKVDLALPGPPGDVWVEKHAHSAALRVRLNGLGARTHANWVLFRLPFDASQTKRLRHVRFEIRSSSRTDVGAVMLGSVCADFPSRGGIASWTSYTTSGIGRTQRFRWHPDPPTADPTILGLNVPTRVANYVACGWDQGDLTAPSDWSLDVTWEER